VQGIKDTWRAALVKVLKLIDVETRATSCMLLKREIVALKLHLLKYLSKLMSKRQQHQYIMYAFKREISLSAFLLQ
jgi:hypothetical protein